MANEQTRLKIFNELRDEDNWFVKNRFTVLTALSSCIDSVEFKAFNFSCVAVFKYNDLISVYLLNLPTIDTSNLKGYTFQLILSSHCEFGYVSFYDEFNRLVKIMSEQPFSFSSTQHIDELPSYVADYFKSYEHMIRAYQQLVSENNMKRLQEEVLYQNQLYYKDNSLNDNSLNELGKSIICLLIFGSIICLFCGYWLTLIILVIVSIILGKFVNWKD